MSDLSLPNNCRHTFALIVAGALLVGCFPAAVHAQSMFGEPRWFTLTNACDAYTSFRKRSGRVALAAGSTHLALGENKAADATHAWLDLGDARKWVSLTCGRYGSDGAGGGPDGNPPAVDDCLAFFDDQHNPERVRGGAQVDMSPPAPSLSAFERSLVAACGEPGQPVSRSAFRSLLTDHPEVLEMLRDFTGERVFADRTPAVSAGGYLDDLTDAWFAAGGFEHIFCGEPERSGSIGGLHYRGRYLQLQRQQLACRMPDNADDQQAIPGAVYTLGVTVQIPSGTAHKSAASYALTLSAEDILAVATRAFLENPTRSRRSEGCLLDVRDGDTQFAGVFVRRWQGIRTFFPGATPDGRRGPQCAAEIATPTAQGRE